MILNFIPRVGDLLYNSCGVFRSYYKLSFLVPFLIVRFNEIKFSAYHPPVFLPEIVYQNFIEYGLPPVIAAVWFFFVW